MNQQSLQKHAGRQNPREVALIAMLCGEPDPEDQFIAGTYSVLVDQDLPISLVASAVLDYFHSNIPVKLLDSFKFFVFAPDSGMVLDESDEVTGYELTKYGQAVDQVSEIVPTIFEVAYVSAQEQVLASGLFVADDLGTAVKRAVVALWSDEVKQVRPVPGLRISAVN